MTNIDNNSQITFADFQKLIRDMYLEKDVARGIDGTFMWLMEEVGELAAALRSGTHEERLGEFADVLAWLATIANVAGVDLAEAVAKKYGSGCPGCGQFVLPLRECRKTVRCRHLEGGVRSGPDKCPGRAPQEVLAQDLEATISHRTV